MKTAAALIVGLTMASLGISAHYARGAGNVGEPVYVSGLAGQAWVQTIDQPEGCLRIRSGPGTAFPVVGCVELGRKLALTGVWTQNYWGMISNPIEGWVAGKQISGAPPPFDVTKGAPAVGTGAVKPDGRLLSKPAWKSRSYRPRHYFFSPDGGVSAARSRVWVGPGGVGVRAGGVGVDVGPGGVRVRVP